MPTFVERLRTAQNVRGSWLCVGLDIDPDKLPKSLLAQHGVTDWWSIVKGAPDNYQRLIAPVVEFAKGIIDKSAPNCCAFKPNMAFFETMGIAGLMALTEILGYIRLHYPSHLVIGDGKRGDIGNTAEQYARSLFGFWGFDAATLSPYLGPDTLEPYFTDPYKSEGRGCIVLCKTSNPGSKSIQDEVLRDRKYAPDGDMTLFEHIACNLFGRFSGTGNLALVAGATFPAQLGAIRKGVGYGVTLLIPGIGKQAGDLAAVIEQNNDGPAIINVSREVLYASSGEDWAEAAGKAAAGFNEQINALRKSA